MPSSKGVNSTTHIENAWDRQAVLQHTWFRPISAELIDAAKI